MINGINMSGDTMKSRHLHARVLTSSVMAVAFTLIAVPCAAAEPADPASAAPVTDAAAAAAGPDDATLAGCSRFEGALNLAAIHYSDFADAIAGPEGNFADPLVQNTNVTGRTALREAVAEALAASNTPGLQPQISAPMRAWAMHATKLLVLMGVRGGRDTLNASANEVNQDTSDVQMACAAAGTHA
jgi:hypothetical protein